MHILAHMHICGNCIMKGRTYYIRTAAMSVMLFLLLWLLYVYVVVVHVVLGGGRGPCASKRRPATSRSIDQDVPERGLYVLRQSTTWLYATTTTTTVNP